MAGVESILSKEYGYVILGIVLHCFINAWMQIQVDLARKKGQPPPLVLGNVKIFSYNYRYKVYYPNLYAAEAENEDAKLFNCIQRGHQNTLENMHIFFILMILGGIKHPIVSASLGLIYNVSRYFFFTGYSTGDPKKRHTLGRYGAYALLGLLGCTISVAVSLLRA